MSFEFWWSSRNYEPGLRGYMHDAYSAGCKAGQESRKPFGELHPANPDATCKCEHWQSCPECHPTAHVAPTQVPVTECHLCGGSCPPFFCDTYKDKFDEPVWRPQRQTEPAALKAPSQEPDDSESIAALREALGEKK